MVRITRHCELCTPTQETKELTFSVKQFNDIDEVTSLQEIGEEGYFLTTCPVGHVVLTIWVKPKFEILADLAFLAIQSKDNRSSILNFYSSLEEYYKFLSRFAAFKLTDSPGTTKIRRSEQFLGSYQASYFYIFGEEGPILSPNLVELRNDVIHNGKIPTIAEVVKFGKATIRVILPGFLKMMTTSAVYRKTLDYEIISRLSGSQVKHDAVQNLTSFGSISLASEIFQEKENPKEFLDLLNQFLSAWPQQN